MNYEQQLKEIIGKKIVSARIRKIKPTDKYLGETYAYFYSKEEIESWDDEPILEIKLEDDSVFLIKAKYGRYTECSQDEYPCFIEVIK